jgi:hypothetical protein
MLKDFGVSWVILGHSERRELQKETSALVAAKAKAAVEAGLSVMICVGETLAEREGGKIETVQASVPSRSGPGPSMDKRAHSHKGLCEGLPSKPPRLARLPSYAYRGPRSSWATTWRP